MQQRREQLNSTYTDHHNLPAPNSPSPPVTIPHAATTMSPRDNLTHPCHVRWCDMVNGRTTGTQGLSLASPTSFTCLLGVPVPFFDFLVLRRSTHDRHSFVQLMSLDLPVSDWGPGRRRRQCATCTISWSSQSP